LAWFGVPGVPCLRVQTGRQAAVVQLAGSVDPRTQFLTDDCGRRSTLWLKDKGQLRVPESVATFSTKDQKSADCKKSTTAIFVGHV